MGYEKRERKDGTTMYQVNITVPEKPFRDGKEISLECRQPLTAVLRVAIRIGLGRLDKEYRKHCAGEESAWEKLQYEIETDGRKTARRGMK